MTVEVYALDDAGDQQGLVVSRTFERDVAAPDYEATQDPDAEDRAIQTLAVPPGRYVVEVSVEDGSSGRALVRELSRAGADALALVRGPRARGRSRAGVGALALARGRSSAGARVRALARGDSRAGSRARALVRGHLLDGDQPCTPRKSPSATTHIIWHL